MTPHANTQDLETWIQARIGAKVRELRASTGITSLQLARLAGISQGQLSKIENGRATLSIKILGNICAALNRPLSYLFLSDEEIPRVLGTLTSVEGPENEAILRFAQDVYERTNHSISLIPLKESQLGSPGEQVDQLRQGIIDIFIEQLYHYGKFVTDYSYLSLPYIFSSESHQRAFLESDYFIEKMKAPLPAQGIRFINNRWNWIRGLEWVIVSSRPIIAPADVKGLRVRIYESSVLARFWEELGAIPVVVPWSDVRTSLRQKEIDILPTHKAHVYPLSFCRYTPFVTLLGDIPPVLGVAMNDLKYRMLPPSLQETLIQVCDSAGDSFSACIREAEESNELLNIKRFNAAYIKVDTSLWKKEAERVREILIDKGIVQKDVSDAINACKPPDK